MLTDYFIKFLLKTWYLKRIAKAKKGQLKIQKDTSFQPHNSDKNSVKPKYQFIIEGGKCGLKSKTF